MNTRKRSHAGNRRSIEGIAAMIMSYLYRCPRAQDTIEGITQWWLLEEEFRFRMDWVREALDRLVKAGMVISDHRPDGHVHYRLNPGPHSRN